MTLPRREFLRLAAGVAALPAWPRVARSQAYPVRPVRLIVGFAAGGTTDLGARLMGQWLSERLGQQFVIENRPGASTNIATEAVVRAPADGYMLLLASASNAVNTALYEKLNFDFIRDIVPVGGLIRVSLVMVVNPSLATRTVPEFIAYAERNSGKVNIANGATGGADYVSGELFKMMTGINLIQVPYRGQAPALTDLLGGQVQVMFSSIPAAIEFIRTGKLQALAVTTAERAETLPDVRTVGEFIPGFEASQWYGIGAPKGTPAEIVEKLNKEINAGLADPKIRTRLADFGGTVLPGSSADFGKLIADETEKWGKVVKFAGIKPV
jgi:tripartite-type tricarboxylate transporter receptor subunit TctC